VVNAANAVVVVVAAKEKQVVAVAAAKEKRVVAADAVVVVALREVPVGVADRKVECDRTAVAVQIPLVLSNTQ
jgi:hypothetical protein